jgi:hypothetical protein
MYNIGQETWDNEILSIIATDDSILPLGTNASLGATDRLRDMLGPVERDCGKPLGTIDSFFILRYGFDPGSSAPPAFLDLNLPLQTVPLN